MLCRAQLCSHVSRPPAWCRLACCSCSGGTAAPPREERSSAHSPGVARPVAGSARPAPQESAVAGTPAYGRLNRRVRVEVQIWQLHVSLLPIPVLVIPTPPLQRVRSPRLRRWRVHQSAHQRVRLRAAVKVGPNAVVHAVVHVPPLGFHGEIVHERGGAYPVVVVGVQIHPPRDDVRLCGHGRAVPHRHLHARLSAHHREQHSAQVLLPNLHHTALESLERTGDDLHAAALRQPHLLRRAALLRRHLLRQPHDVLELRVCHWARPHEPAGAVHMARVAPPASVEAHKVDHVLHARHKRVKLAGHAHVDQDVRRHYGGGAHAGLTLLNR
eukprot:scaffold17376_cov118-Isochrysis_galbana.AAC.10